VVTVQGVWTTGRLRGRRPPNGVGDVNRACRVRRAKRPTLAGYPLLRNGSGPRGNLFSWGGGLEQTPVNGYAR